MSNATRILIALFIGLALGVIAAAQAPVIGVQIAYWLDIVGSLWLNGLRMTVVPLVVALLVTDIVKSAEAESATTRKTMIAVRGGRNEKSLEVPAAITAMNSKKMWLKNAIA